MTLRQPSFGRTLRKHREKILREGLRALSLRSRIHPSLISRIERGADTNLSTALKLVDAYGLKTSLAVVR